MSKDDKKKKKKHGKLKELFNLLVGGKKIVPGKTALLIIDVQREYCAPEADPDRPADVTAKIEATVKAIIRATPAFRAAAIPVYVVCMNHERMREDGVEIYKFQMEKDDVLVEKDDASAFKGSKIEETLRTAGRKHLLMCGFNFSACVKATALDAHKAGFKVTVLTDLSTNAHSSSTSEAGREMRREGIALKKSDQVLRRLEK